MVASVMPLAQDDSPAGDGRLAAWTLQSLAECRAAAEVAVQRSVLTVLPHLAAFLRVPCSGSAELSHPTCSAGHPLRAVLRLGHRLRLGARVSLDGLQETDVVDLGPLLREMGKETPGFRKLLHEPPEFFELWLRFGPVEPTLGTTLRSTRCGHSVWSRVECHVALGSDLPVEAHLGEMLGPWVGRDFCGSAWALRREARCGECGHSYAAVLCQRTAVRRPRVLHFHRPSRPPEDAAPNSADAELGEFPDSLQWLGRRYRLVGAISVERELGRSRCGCMVRIEATELFRLRDANENAVVVNFTEGSRMLRGRCTDILYERLG